MTCRDFMLRVCLRKSCKMHHVVEKCTDKFCNKNKCCKRVHLTDYEVNEINQNVCPFRESVNMEMHRLAYLLRETFPPELREHCCTLNMLGQCIWTCLACKTIPSSSKYFHRFEYIHKLD